MGLIRPQAPLNFLICSGSSVPTLHSAPWLIHGAHISADALLTSDVAPLVVVRLCHAHQKVCYPSSSDVGFGSRFALCRIAVRRATMSTFDVLPGELNASIISSIMNSICPQCGGRMWEFQCEGRCRRNWLAEWEWANRRSSESGCR